MRGSLSGLPIEVKTVYLCAYINSITVAHGKHTRVSLFSFTKKVHSIHRARGKRCVTMTRVL